MAHNKLLRINFWVRNADRDSGALECKGLLRIVLMTSLVILWLYFSSSSPLLSIVILDLALCSFLAKLFNTRHALWFLLHPALLLLISQQFTTSFLLAGDGEAYVAVVQQYLDANTLEFQVQGLYEVYGLLGFFKYASLGVTAVIAFPEYVFGNISDEIYYLWQGTLHVFLVSVVVLLAQTWKIFEKKVVLVMALFSAISPSFFDLGAAPTRHIVTFFGIFLLFVSHTALVNRISIERLLWFSISILIILISKWALIIPYAIFLICDIFLLQRFRLTFKSLAVLFSLVLIGFSLLPELIATVISYLAGTAQTGASTFSGLTRIPLIGWLVKYVYALLAPFPWTEAAFFTETIYSGNRILFIMHVLSAVVGLYLFLIVVFNAKRISRADIQLKRMILFPVVMSLSIIGGATGFHTYLLIYFPMLAPLLLLREYRISPLVPLAFVATLELFVLVAR